VTGFLLAVPAFGILSFPYTAFVMLFCAGMTVASLVRLGVIGDLSHAAMSVAGLVLLGFVATQFQTSFGLVQTLGLASFFLIVVRGNTMFGLLATRAAHRLSNISYSIYLTHGLLLSIVFSIPGMKDIALVSPARFWAVGILLAPCLVLTSSLTYRAIERPGIAFGRLWAAHRAKAALIPLTG
jgi:peptidoglycan/LPS O-acetylase OafA/YrhL